MKLGFSLCSTTRSEGVLRIYVEKNIWTQERASNSTWSEFLATDPEVPGSIPSDTRFSEK
jgi:hypothetical protein